MKTSEQIENNFRHADPDGTKKTAYDQMRRQCKQLAGLIDLRMPDCREKSIALTKLEEVMFWANAGMARNVDETIKYSRGGPCS